MIEKGYKVVWAKRSGKQMRPVFKHISKDPPKNASKAVPEIADEAYKAETKKGYPFGSKERNRLTWIFYPW
jgi:hypothetical protein